MIPAVVASIILVPVTILIHYEALRLIADWLLPRPGRFGLRWRMMVVVLACFAAHTVEVWFYALGYYVFDNLLGLGSFAGLKDGTFADYVYFSGVTYTSLGFGDISPLGGPRLIAGVEGLNGLLLIGWSASFTYLVMEQFWPLHGSHAWRRVRESRPRPPGEAGEAD